MMSPLTTVLAIVRTVALAPIEQGSKLMRAKGRSRELETASLEEIGKRLGFAAIDLQEWTDQGDLKPTAWREFLACASSIEDQHRHRIVHSPPQGSNSTGGSLDIPPEQVQEFLEMTGPMFWGYTSRSHLAVADPRESLYPVDLYYADHRQM